MGKLMIIVLLSWISADVCAQTDWQLRRDEDGIKVFTASTPNSNFKSIKVELTLKATPSQLVAFLMDVERQHDWIYNNKSAQLVKKISENELIAYSEYNVPWPCCNRDYIAHITFSQLPSGVVIVDSRADPEILPAKSGKVRIKKSEAHWDVANLGNNLLKVVYTVHCDPGGALPAWLSNIFLTKAPFQTFRKLRDEVNRPEYQNARLGFIRE